MIEVIRSLEKTKEKTCVALGFFDGIHIGHRHIIENMVSTAEKRKFVPVVFTFSNSPQEVITGRPVKKIVSLDEKISILSSLGVKKVYLIDFKCIMSLSADDFIDKVIIGKLNAKDVFCGFNYHFGVDKSGDSDYLERHLNLEGVNVYINDAISYKGEIVSSTRIRKLIADGNVETANQMLSKNFGFKGKPVKVKKLAEQLVFTKISHELPKDIILPKFGAYKSIVRVSQKAFDSITNIGMKPEGSNSSVPILETFILGYNRVNPYGKTVEIELLKFLNSEQMVESLKELKKDAKGLVLQNLK